MHSDRKRLRSLLRALLDEREDTQLLYIPHGEEGMRRMIRALLDMRTTPENDPLDAIIKAFLENEMRS